MKQLCYLAKIYVYFMVLFALGKIAFMAYNFTTCPFSLTDLWQVWRHGLSMDASTSGYLVILPWLCCLISLWWEKISFRRILRPYYILVGILLSLILLGDTLLYEYWKFKIDSSIFSYLQNLEGAAASVSTSYIILGTCSLLIISFCLSFLPIQLTPKQFCDNRKPGFNTLVFLIVAGGLFIAIRGGIQEGNMNVGRAYYSNTLFFNHSAVNPAFSILSSISKNKQFEKQFRYFDEKECQSIFDGLYTAETEDITDTLLNNNRPQIIVMLLESFGAKFIEELGGIPDVCPNIGRLIPEGILFDNVYANSFRTDRGTVSAFSGQISYPTASLMRLPAKLDNLPSLARSLKQAGYQTDYSYGGDISIMGKQGYLISAGFEHLTSDKDFSYSQINESKWGANDSLIMDKAFQLISERPLDSHWLSGIQTLNSHEPFEVPYHRLEDPVLNAFAYTDHCLGEFVERLRKTPVWDNLLIVMIPDHGMMYQLTYEDPDFFHIPILWIGGAVKSPKRINTLMNQSDVITTLLSQMGISHKEFKWSRNVLSKNYNYPFAYSTFPSGIMFADSTGVSIYDINSDKEIVGEPFKSQERVAKAKAILQSSYNDLARLGKTAN